MSKGRTFKAIINFKGKERYDRSYVKGRIFQMAKFICTDENGQETVVRMGNWKMKNGYVTEVFVTVRTSEKKFFKFLDMVEKNYPGIVSKFSTNHRK